MKRPTLMDPAFKYVPASRTNIALTFARIKRELKEAAKAQPANVKALPKKKEQRRG